MILQKVVQYLRFSLSVLRKFAVILILLASLAVNIAMLVSSTVAGLASSAVAAVTGARTVFLRRADEITELSKTLDTERIVNRELRSDVASITADLSAERIAHRRTRGELAEVSADLATSSRLIRSETRESASELVGKISARTARAARREIAAMPAESIPIWGTAIIVAVTTLELHDMCQNIQELNSLQKLLDPDADELEEKLTVCSIPVPTRNEVWAAARNSPQAVWSAAQKAMPNAEELRSMELPEIDWTNLGVKIGQNAGSWTDSATVTLRETGNWIGRWWKE
jgi:hypothetical protein